jgi:hypothetical protein
MQTLLLEAFGPLLVAIVLLAVVLSVRRFVRRLRNRQTPEQLQAARDSFRNRLVHPNAAQVEQALAAFLPERLLTLYKDHPTLLLERIQLHRPQASPKDPAEWIEAFLPLDMESQKYTLNPESHNLGKGFFFATDGASNFYWVPAADTRHPDAPVFFVSHDTQANEQVAASLDEFLSWPRTLHADDESAA